MVDRRPLKVLEAREDLIGVDVDAHGRDSRTAVIVRPELLELRWEQAVGRRSGSAHVGQQTVDLVQTLGSRDAARAASVRASGSPPTPPTRAGAAADGRSVSRSSSSASMRSLSPSSASSNRMKRSSRSVSDEQLGRDRFGPAIRSAVQRQPDGDVEVLLAAAVEAGGQPEREEGRHRRQARSARTPQPVDARRSTGCGVCWDSGRARSLMSPRSMGRVASRIVRQRPSPAGSTRARNAPDASSWAARSRVRCSASRDLPVSARRPA